MLTQSIEECHYKLDIVYLKQLHIRDALLELFTKWAWMWSDGFVWTDHVGTVALHPKSNHQSDPFLDPYTNPIGPIASLDLTKSYPSDKSSSSLLISSGCSIQSCISCNEYVTLAAVVPLRAYKEMSPCRLTVATRSPCFATLTISLAAFPNGVVRIECTRRGLSSNFGNGGGVILCVKLLMCCLMYWSVFIWQAYP